MLWKGNSYTRKRRVRKIKELDSQISKFNLFNEEQPELNEKFYLPKSKKQNKIQNNTEFLNENIMFQCFQSIIYKHIIIQKHSLLPSLKKIHTQLITAFTIIL